MAKVTTSTTVKAEVKASIDEKTTGTTDSEGSFGAILACEVVCGLQSRSQNSLYTSLIKIQENIKSVCSPQDFLFYILLISDTLPYFL